MRYPNCTAMDQHHSPIWVGDRDWQIPCDNGEFGPQIHGKNRMPWKKWNHRDEPWNAGVLLHCELFGILGTFLTTCLEIPWLLVRIRATKKNFPLCLVLYFFRPFRFVHFLSLILMFSRRFRIVFVVMISNHKHFFLFSLFFIFFADFLK